jgi:hypothetical protein
MTQVFKKMPTLEILNKILSAIGLDVFKEEYTFRKKDFEKWESISKIIAIKSELSEFYFPCKAKIYLENIDEQKVITILRQFLRALNYNIISKEKYSNGEKYIMYTLVGTHHINSPKTKIIYWK